MPLTIRSQSIKLKCVNDFVNGRKVDLLSETIEPHFYEVRVIGSFYNEMDFRLFPFEELNLSIEIEPQSPLEVDQLQLRIDPETGIDEVAKVPGWLVGEYTITSDDHDYGGGEVYSRVTVDFRKTDLSRRSSQVWHQLHTEQARRHRRTRTVGR